MLDSLKEEVEEAEEVDEVVKDLDIVSSQVIKCGETAVSTVERLSSCVGAELRKMYPLTSQRLEVVDEQVNIIKATLFNNTATVVRRVSGRNWKDKTDLSSSSNYLLRKMKRKLSSLQRDMKRMMVDLKNLQNRVTEMIEAGQAAA